jgi:hypothetical protein
VAAPKGGCQAEGLGCLGHIILPGQQETLEAAEASAKGGEHALGRRQAQLILELHLESIVRC